LRERLNQFERSATKGVEGHSEGETYYKKYGGIQPNLYVATLPIDVKSICDEAYIKHLERKFLWEYCQQNGNLPEINKD